MRIPSGTTDQFIYFFGVDSTDFTTPETGLSSFTVYRSRNGAAAAAFTTPTINETDSSNMAGVYELLLDEDMTIDSGDDEQEMVFYITHAGMAPVVRTITLFRPKITVGNTLSAESDGDLTKVNTLDGHTAQTGDNYARIGAAGASLTDLGGMSTGMKAEVNAEADTALADYDAIVPADLPTNFADMAIEETTGIVDSNIEKVDTNAAAAGRLRQWITEWASGTVQADSGTSITLDSGGSAVDDFYNGGLLIVHSGTGAGQAKTILDYVGSTKVATIEEAFSTSLSTDSDYLILPAGGVSVEAINGVPAAASAMESCFTGTITTFDALDTAQDSQHSTTQGKVDTAQADLDTITDDGVTLADSVTHGGTSAVLSLQNIIFTTTGSTDSILITGSGAGNGIAFARSGSGDVFDAAVAAALQSEAADAVAAYDGPTRTEATADKDEIIAQGDSAWATATGFSTLDAAGIRTAVGMASADLDDQLDALPTAAENRAEMDSNSTQLALLEDILEADRYIDTSPTPWQLVLVKQGTGALGVGDELLRQDLKDTDGTNLASAATVIGQTVTP